MRLVELTMIGNKPEIGTRPRPSMGYAKNNKKRRSMM
jgi:hypothetical protein